MNSIISASKSSPAIFIDSDFDAPPDATKAISVVPAPTFTIKCPLGSNISIPAPIAATIGSSTKYTSFIPKSLTTLKNDLFSTCVTPLGTQTIALPCSTASFPIPVSYTHLTLPTN